MKKLIFMLCLAALPHSCRQIPAGEFHIEGHLKNIADSTVINLFRYEGNLGMKIASDTVVNGSFLFIVPMTEKIRLSLDIPDSQMIGRTIWAVPGNRVTVKGSGNHIYTWNVKSHVPEQAEYDRYMLESKTEYDQIQKLLSEESKVGSIEAHDKRMAVQDSLKKLETPVRMAIYRNDMDIMKRTPVSEIWLDKLYDISSVIKYYEKYSPLREDAERLYENLSEEQKAKPIARAIHLNLFPPPTVEKGDMMADAELKDINGRLHRLSDYKGKYIVLDFWGSGCGPCINSMPELREVSEKYGNAVTVVSINIDISEKSWITGSEMFAPPGVNLNAPLGNDIKERYGVSAIPHTVIISPEGIILDSWIGYHPYRVEQQLLELFSEAK